MDADLVVKYLRDSIPQGEHQNPHAERISVRMDVVLSAIELIESNADTVEWLEKGNDEWRTVAMAAQKTLKSNMAALEIAITHLMKVLRDCRTADEQFAADKNARDWLDSIGR